MAASGAHSPLMELSVLLPSALSPCWFPFPFFKAWRPRQPFLPAVVLLRWRNAGWGCHLPSPCPRLHSPTCPQPWAALPSISSSSSPPAMARRQVLPGVQVTPLGCFGLRVVPGCLSPEMCCFGAGGLSAFKWGQVGMPQLGCPGMNIQGLRAWLPLHNHSLSEPRSICIRPCIPPSPWASFQPHSVPPVAAPAKDRHFTSFVSF